MFKGTFQSHKLLFMHIHHTYGRDPPCYFLYKLQIVLKVDSATGFCWIFQFVIILVWFLKGFVFAVDGICGNGDAK